jgi:pimeloyl-ACP methyl ester carboxylesterase
LCKGIRMPFVNTRLARLHYDDLPASLPGGASKSPPVVLLHGFFLDRTMWKPQLAPLTTLTRVINLEGPAHGLSDASPSALLETQADAVVDALDALKVERAIVCGLSWGGMLAMRVAIRHSERLAGLVLCGTSAGATPLYLSAYLKASARLFERHRLPFWITKRFIVPSMYGPAMRRIEPSLYQETHARIAAMNATSTAIVARTIIDRSNVLGQLHTYKGPALIICGERDTVTPIVASEAMARALPQADFLRVPRTGHLVSYEAPETVNARLIPFIQSCLRANAAP